MRNYGYFILVFNEVRDPIEDHALYRSKGMMEKRFDNWKN